MLSKTLGIGKKPKSSQPATKRYLSQDAKASADQRRRESISKFYNLKKKDTSSAKPQAKSRGTKLSEAAKRRQTESIAKAIDKQKKSRESKLAPPKVKSQSRRQPDTGRLSQRQREAYEKSIKKLKGRDPKITQPKIKRDIIKPSTKSKQRQMEAIQKSINKVRGVKTPKEGGSSAVKPSASSKKRQLEVIQEASEDGFWDSSDDGHPTAELSGKQLKDLIDRKIALIANAKERQLDRLNQMKEVV